jgi:RNA polymerase sigma-70 factor (ECF subfamily)
MRAGSPLLPPRSQEHPVTFHPRRIDAAHPVCHCAAAIQSLSDEALMGCIAARNEAALRVLFARHQVRIYRFVLRYVADRQLAEDVVSEVFLEVWCRAARFEARSLALTWLLAIARRKALSVRRRRSGEPLDVAAAIADPADDPELAARRKNQGEVLRACLARLSTAHREIVDLVYYHGMSVAEVAHIAGIPENTAKTRMFHARKHLHALLAAVGIAHSAP